MKKLSISIPSPCHENWSNMTPREKGRFCSNCQKVVVDFTKMSNQEIVNHLTSEKKVCGQFRSSQLNRSIQINPTKTTFYFPYQIAVASLLLLTSPSCGQDGNKQRVELKQTKGEVDLKADTKEKNRKGFLTDEEGNGIAERPITIQYNSKDAFYTFTDKSGYFYFPESIQINSIKYYVLTGVEKVTVKASPNTTRINNEEIIQVKITSYDETILDFGHVHLGVPHYVEE